ncbi:SpoIID/LytB domain-containing protein [Nocardioides sp. SR21]|uniref:SpoIID/LytB domain-containing protein n=1 Tax=Nocardioides sp. SR21 TaxID=2919501 RepID=UPI001FAA1846|nr:SpoIID/LytB domain-containing protein [Nocardioides sp. SR21]
MLGRLAAATVTASVTVLVATAAPAIADEPVDVPDGATITIDGRGAGHGRGMSQQGAQQAAEDGVGYRQILGFYYPGTDRGTAAGQVRIFLSRGDLDNTVQVHPQRGLTARAGAKSWDLTKAKPRAQRWRIVPKGDARSVLQYRQAGWHAYRTVSGTLQFAAKGKPITLDTQTGPARYRGLIRSVPSRPGNRMAINVLPMESYLRGVVPAEVVASQWPQQAQRAQAVAARSYAALKRSTRQDKPYDLDDTIGYQRYLGVDREWPASDKAVAATAGEILTYDGQPAFTEFTASNGGWTVAGDEPYLIAQEDAWDDDTWGPVDFTDSEIEGHWPGLGDLERIEITSRDGNGAWGGRVLSVTLTGDEGAETLEGSEFYGELGLQSDWLTLTVH